MPTSSTRRMRYDMGGCGRKKIVNKCYDFDERAFVDYNLERESIFSRLRPAFVYRLMEIELDEAKSEKMSTRQ